LTAFASIGGTGGMTGSRMPPILTDRVNICVHEGL
jgi:hypothetical protein